MTRAWLRRWVHLIASEPGFQFLRRLKVVEASDTEPDQFELVVAELVGRFERRRLRTLESLELSEGFSCIEGQLGRRLATVATSVSLVDEQCIAAEVRDDSTESRDSRSFPAPPASSWQYQEMP
jgi:hypothetical protein